jgi:hypothetical protein
MTRIELKLKKKKKKEKKKISPKIILNISISKKSSLIALSTQLKFLLSLNRVYLLDVAEENRLFEEKDSEKKMKF